MDRLMFTCCLVTIIFHLYIDDPTVPLCMFDNIMNKFILTCYGCLIGFLMFMWGWAIRNDH